MKIYGKKKKSVPTKVIIKVSLECKNFPVSFKIYGPYERIVECFKYFEDEVKPQQKYEIFGVLTDFDRVLKNVVTETSMAMKVNRLSLDYDQITKEFGYAPDFIEFNDMANRIVNENMSKLVPEYNLNNTNASKHSHDEVRPRMGGGNEGKDLEDAKWFKVA
ncbi:MAG: hypothetical protein QE271_09625 [Bacteriovoracaceae bacterium]|nr:hypothetical protein [Bacteriovoracaceae bacterium]